MPISHSSLSVLMIHRNALHRVMEFDQSPFLKDYIDFYTEKRKQANNSLKNIYYNAVLAKQWKIYETDVI